MSSANPQSMDAAQVTGSLEFTQRSFLAASAAASALALAQVIAPGDTQAAPAGEAAGVRPFSVGFPEEAIVDLRRRIAATRRPEKETDATQGVQLATMQKLVQYWGGDYD